MQRPIPLTEPDIGPEEIEAVTRVLQGRWLTMGPVTFAFEREFASGMGVKHAFAVNSCTAALHLAYLAVGLKEGDEIICPALTFVATANAARYTGASVVFADITSPDELTLNPRDVEKKISARTKAIAVMHYGGFACAMEELTAIADRHRLVIVEDCAHAPFAWIPAKDGTRQYVGTIGAAGCFSFFGNKNMTTGEGGMITTNNDEIAAKIQLLRSHGMTTLTYDRDRGHAGQYDVVALGFNYRLDEIRSAIGLCQLAKIHRLNESRRLVYSWYREELCGIPRIIVPFKNRPLDQSACHIMSVLVGTECYAAVKNALRDRGVQTSKHYELVSNFSEYLKGGSPGCCFADYDLMTLPLSPAMSREDVAWIGTTIRDVLVPSNRAIRAVMS